MFKSHVYQDSWVWGLLMSILIWRWKIPLTKGNLATWWPFRSSKTQILRLWILNQEIESVEVLPTANWFCCPTNTQKKISTPNFLNICWPQPQDCLSRTFSTLSPPSMVSRTSWPSARETIETETFCGFPSGLIKKNKKRDYLLKKHTTLNFKKRQQQTLNSRKITSSHECLARFTVGHWGQKLSFYRHVFPNSQIHACHKIETATRGLKKYLTQFGCFTQHDEHLFLRLLRLSESVTEAKGDHLAMNPASRNIINSNVIINIFSKITIFYPLVSQLSPPRPFRRLRPWLRCARRRHNRRGPRDSSPDFLSVGEDAWILRKNITAAWLNFTNSISW